MEFSNNIVRQNMILDKHYVPYCGNNLPKSIQGGCSNPRTFFNGNQMECGECGWKSSFPSDFIEIYKEEHSLNQH